MLAVECKGIMLLCCCSFLLPRWITSCNCHFNTVHLPVPWGAAWQFWKSLPLWCYVCAVACYGFVFFWEWSPNTNVYLCPVLCPSALKRLFSRRTRCARQTELKVLVPHVHWFCMLFRIHQRFLCKSTVALNFVGTLSQYWGTHATHHSGSVAQAAEPKDAGSFSATAAVFRMEAKNKNARASRFQRTLRIRWCKLIRSPPNERFLRVNFKPVPLTDWTGIWAKCNS